MGLTIAQLQLAPNARRGAEWVRARHPEIVFTSGRRDVLDQARVMAQNTVKYGRAWIGQTYRPSSMIDTLNEWLHQHDDIHETKQIADGFYECLLACHSSGLSRLSRHLTGDAWDAAWPGDVLGDAIVKNIVLNMPAEYGLDRVINREGGLRVLHVQFTPSIAI
jgi:hypothetical protein